MRFLLLLLFIPAIMFAQTPFVDSDINAGETFTLTEGEYLMDGFVYVEDGATLIIEPGTVIYGAQVPSNGDRTSALIIARGGQIIADGTPSKPIIMTSELDDLTDPFDLGPNDRGLWGGLLILGRASLNTTTGEGQIEGIDPLEPRGAYGGGATPDDNDNSGIVRYLSLRHGGDELGSANEINGVTFGGVGAGTIIEFVEVVSNLDDGFEWFGGTVNTRFLVSAFVGDDDFDFDEGMRGNHQFWFALKEPVSGGGRIGEHDGGTSPEDGTPYATPMISNATYIGAGATALPAGDGSQAIYHRDNCGGFYYNSIITEYNSDVGSCVALTIEDLGPLPQQDSQQRLADGDLVYANNLWWDFGAGNTPALIWTDSWTLDSLTANNNLVVDPQINAIDRDQNNLLDPRPSAAGPANGSAMEIGDAYYYDANYHGAFDSDLPLWTNLWTALYQENITINNDAIDQNLLVDWNLVSLPVEVVDPAYATLYPNAISGTLFGFSGAYVAEDSLEWGQGYWLRMPAAETVSVHGASRFSATIDLNLGWNFLGSISVPVDVADIQDQSGVIIAGTIFGFNGAYTAATTINPGEGYWVRASAAGTISLDFARQSTPKSAKYIVSENHPALIVTDAKGVSQTLFLNNEVSEEVMVSYSLPPMPPAGAFDARFVNDYRLSNKTEDMVKVQSMNYPLTITAQNLGNDEVLVNGEKLSEKSSVRIADNKIGAFTVSTLTGEVSGNIPTEFAVSQNYPNPFNPTTVINYALPKASSVEVSIFNSLGQKVKSLVSSNQDAGYHSVTWNATNELGDKVSSGIYYYVVKAGEFQSVNKMSLIK